jgi:predicted phage terminase large subunit-like protein
VEARSKATKDMLWHWYTKVALSRVMGKGGAVVVTMTRWAEDDLLGRLTNPDLGYTTEEEAAQWTVINIPSEAEEDDPLGREVGEILWPERTPRAFLRSFRSLDPAGYAALYMGRPAPPEGNFFKREQIQEYMPHELPTNLRYYAASDHAISLEQNRDKTCMGMVGVDEEDNIWILPDVVWAQLDAENQVEAMIQLMESYKPLAWWAEKGHISKSLGPFLRKRMAEEQVYVNVVEKTPATDKMTRAQAIQGRMSMGKVFFPKFAPWYADAVDQMLNFPNGAHDDFVDFIAWIGRGLATQLTAQAAPRKKKEPRTGSLDWILQESERDRRDRDKLERDRRYLH